MLREAPVSSSPKSTRTRRESSMDLARAPLDFVNSPQTTTGRALVIFPGALDRFFRKCSENVLVSDQVVPAHEHPREVREVDLPRPQHV